MLDRLTDIKDFMPHAVIRRRGNLADCALVDGLLPRNVLDQIEASLSYDHITFVRGRAAWCEDGVKRPVRKFPTQLFVYDSQGRIAFPQGFRRRVRQILTDNMITSEEISLDAPRGVSGRFEFHPERIYDFFGKDPFRARQDEALAVIIGSDGGLIVAPPAFGKTHLLAMLCVALPNARFSISTSRQDVALTIRQRLTKHIPDVGLIGAGGKHFGRRVTVFVNDSLHKDVHDENESDFLLVDEVHEAAAPEMLKALSMYQRARMFGLTASIAKRSDNADIRLEGLFGPVLFEMSVPEATELGLIAPVIIDMIPVEMAKNPADEFTQDAARERAAIWNNPYRNQLIVEQARRFDENTQVLIMVRSIEHGLRLKQMLPEYEFCYDKISETDRLWYVKNGLLRDDEPTMNKVRRGNLRRRFETQELKKCIANDVWSTGVDFVGLSVLIRADGRASRIMSDQIPGRAIRIHSDKEYAYVIDFMDKFDNSTLRNSQARKKAYIENGWTVNTLDKVPTPCQQ